MTQREQQIAVAAAEQEPPREGDGKTLLEAEQKDEERSGTSELQAAAPDHPVYSGLPL